MAEHVSSGPLGIRPATPREIDEVVAVVNAAYRAGEGRGWTTEADLLGGQRIDATMLSELISSRDTTLLVAESDGRIIGCCALTIRQSDRTASFGLLAVDPLVQGGAVGSQLLEAAEHQATSSGCIRVELDVIDVRTELVAWYRRRGFAPTGTTRPFPYGDERFGLPKRAHLQFMTLSKSLTPSTHVTAEP